MYLKIFVFVVYRKKYGLDQECIGLLGMSCKREGRKSPHALLRSQWWRDACFDFFGVGYQDFRAFVFVGIIYLVC